MARNVLLGIDLGTSVLKAAAVDACTGRALAESSVPLATRAAADGTREQDPSTMDRALATLARRLRRRVGAAWQRMVGVGLAAQGGSAMLVDRRTGRALTPVQLWSDTRPLHLLPEIAARKPAGYWRRLSYSAGPGEGLARIKWLRERYRRLFQGDNLYVGAGEYVYFKLTDVWRQDAGNALQIGCYDARRRRLSAAPLRLVGVGPSFVAPMREGHETHPLGAHGAEALGLPEGLPVAGPYMDHEAGYLSGVGISRRPLLCSLGTAWVGSFVLPQGPPAWPGAQLVLPSPVGPGTLVLQVMPAGTASWDWALETMTCARGARGLARADAVFCESLLPPPGLVALPWLTRPNPFVPVATGGGGFVGVDAHTTRADLLRAMAAGMCFELAHLLWPVRACGAVDSVVLCGGASQNRHFRTLLAAMFAPLPVYCLEDDQTAGGRGAVHALLGGASGLRPRARRVRRPSMALVKQVRERRQQYCQVCQALSRGIADGGGAIFAGHFKGKKR